MEYIQNLYYMVPDYWILTMLIGLMSCFVESYIPALPLIGIVTGNAMFFGFLNGMILSWIGSGLGTILLFLLTKKFKDSIHMQRFKNEKINKVINWIYKQGFKVLFIAYCCPFVPGFLVTITSALSGKDIRNFAPAMLCGKFIMFLVVSYPASDVVGFIKNPIKIVLFILLVFLAWKVGNSINTKLDKNN